MQPLHVLLSSLCLYVCQSVCMVGEACLPVCLSVCQSVCLSGQCVISVGVSVSLDGAFVSIINMAARIIHTLQIYAYNIIPFYHLLIKVY